MSLFDKIGSGLKQAYNWAHNGLNRLWDDFTGKTAIDKQNQANMELAKYQTQMNEEFYNKYSSPEALMRQFREAGLNPNLVYGSASAGQSNVPSFNAPHVERNMSGSEKLNKALSVASAVQGLMQGQYQTVAAREAAEQSALKTINDRTNALRNKLDFDTESSIIDYMPSLGHHSFYKRSSLGRQSRDVSVGLNTSDESPLAYYSRAAREARINQFAMPALENQFNYGFSDDGYGNQYYLPKGFVPYQQTRLKKADLDYQLTDELKRLGVYGRLGLAAAKLFF